MVYGNPCCNFSLKVGTKIIAVIDMIIACLSIAGLGVILAVLGSMKKHMNNNSRHHESNKPAASDDQVSIDAAIAVVSVVLVYFVLQAALGAYLFNAANKRKARSCRNWCIISTILLVLTILGFIIVAVVNGVTTSHAITTIVELIYRTYALWVVIAFVEDMNEYTLPTRI